MSQRADDVQYLKQHHVALILERLVGELIRDKPPNAEEYLAATCVLSLATTNLDPAEHTRDVPMPQLCHALIRILQSHPKLRAQRSVQSCVAALKRLEGGEAGSEPSQNTAPGIATVPEGATGGVGERASKFHTFHPERFRFPSPPPVAVQEWLVRLPAADHRPEKRFAAGPIADMVARLEAFVTGLASEAESVTLKRVEGVCGRYHQPAALRQCIARAPVSRVLPEHLFALVAYSFELYEDFASERPEVSCEFQIYREFNTMCRTYGHCRLIDEGIQREWELFLPFTARLDAAIRALPPIEAVLFRGMGYGTATHQYSVGSRGSWGGCLSASSDRLQAATFVSKDSQLHAKDGSFFMVLSDQARPIFHLSRFPEEMEHLHPLDLVLEVCHVLPASVCQMLSLKINILTFKRADATLSFALWVAALKALGFIYDPFLRSYIPPLVKEDPYAVVTAPIEDKLSEFLDSPETVLLIAATAGMGKTACALWLSRHVEYLDRIWLFISLPAVEDPFGRHAIVRHVAAMLGFQDGDQAFAQLRQQRMVWILDSLDEVLQPVIPVTQSWWEVNELDEWDVKLVVSCRQEHVHDYGPCMGPQPRTLYLQGFKEQQMAQYVRRRLLWSQPEGASDGTSHRNTGEPSCLPGATRSS